MAKTPAQNDISTDERIKEAARSVFTRKGYAATRTRDIAEEAGINLALLNYYFRSKEKLFNLIMTESVQKFMQVLKDVLNNEQTSLEEKIELIVNVYTDVLSQNPSLPLFILSEIRTHPDELLSNMGIKDFIFTSHFIRQYQQLTREKGQKGMHPLQLIMTIIGMTVFPFIASPLVQKIVDLNEQAFLAMMQERKKILPVWIKAILDAG